MKAIWKGSIAFGLVNIPVKLYAAVQPKQISFKLLCGKCHTPLKYKRYCPKCKREVVWQDVVKGIKIGNKYIVLSKEQLKKLRPEQLNVIEIVGFIKPETVDKIYFHNNYYIAPDTKSAKAYFLLQEVLRTTATAAVARLVLHEKEYTALITAYKQGLLLTTLYYDYEVRDINAITEIAEAKKKTKITKQELQLALMLVEKLSKKQLKLEQFKDSFVEKLKAMLAGKIEKPAQPQPEKLIEALQLSIKQSVKQRKRKKEV